MAVLTRFNTITGVAYKDDPTIFAWELMNEPCYQSDLSGRNLQDWIREMAGYVKSIDKHHLLEIGLKGFYGESMPEKKGSNPGYQVRTDFIFNNQISEVNSATIHLYPDQWVPGSSDATQMAFVDRWVQAHILDSNSIIRKPLVLVEFGKSSRSSGYTVSQRDAYLRGYTMSFTPLPAQGAPAVVGSFGNSWPKEWAITVMDMKSYWMRTHLQLGLSVNNLRSYQPLHRGFHRVSVAWTSLGWFLP